MQALRFGTTVALALALAFGAAGATPKEIEAAVRKGADSLKQQYQNATPAQLVEGNDGIGPTALAGLALLESGVPADDAAIKAITAAVREASYAETRTYQITLCLLYLDRFGDPADEPLIQMLAIRLIVGQNGRGGWTYSCIERVSAADEARLRASLSVVELKAGAQKPEQKPEAPGKPTAVGKLHAEVQKYAAKLAPQQGRSNVDDNSNTQFGILGVWVARRHGVGVESALALIEKRFLASQTASGGWPYAAFMDGTPSMTCAGLLALSTAVARREERRAKAAAKPEPAAKPAMGKAPATPADPFFTAPKPEDEPAKAPAKANNARKPQPDARDAAIQKALASLGNTLAGKGRGGAGLLNGNRLGDRDFYFLWSLERVGVIFDVEKIGNVDWYAVGADALIDAQHPTGGWGRPPRGTMVESSFALLFLSRSNLVRDLTTKVHGGTNTELRAGAFPGGGGAGAGAGMGAAAAPVPRVAVAPAPRPVVAMTKPPAKPAAVVAASAPAASGTSPVVPALPAPKPEEIKALVAELCGATGADWSKVLVRLRDAKGAQHTHALVAAVGRLDGEKRKEAREALAERLTRMTAGTLREMARDPDPELRRGAVLAMAMKDDAAHVPDLIVAVADADSLVVRAARAGLKSLTGEDFGPVEFTAPDRAAAISAWAEWLKKNPK